MAIENLDKLISKLEKLDDVNQAMEQACILVENEAKIKCPVDNGLLRNSITHYIEDNPDELVGVVGTNSVAEKVMAYYDTPSTLSGSIVLNDEKPLDNLTMPNQFEEESTGIIKSIEGTFGQQITKGEVEVKNMVLIEYRLAQLEEKVNKHNNLIERTYQLEKQVAIIQEEIKE